MQIFSSWKLIQTAVPLVNGVYWVRLENIMLARARNKAQIVKDRKLFFPVLIMRMKSIFHFFSFYFLKEVSKFYHIKQIRFNVKLARQVGKNVCFQYAFNVLHQTSTFYLSRVLLDRNCSFMHVYAPHCQQSFVYKADLDSHVGRHSLVCNT